MDKNKAKEINTLDEIFSFDEQQAKRDFFHEINAPRKFIKSFNYIASKLPIQKIKKDLEKLEWEKGKNYSWAVVQQNEITLIIRRYGSHFTIYFRDKTKDKDDEDDYSDYFTTKWGCFVFSTDQDKLDDPDDIVNDPFMDINKLIPGILKHIEAGKVWLLWNNASLPREKWVEIKNVWNGGEDITSADLFLFALDELFSEHLGLYAQTDMLEMVKRLKPGDKIGDKVVASVTTELKDDYYHGVGVQFTDKSDYFKDVYYLTRWSHAEVIEAVEKNG